jgi:hypothetical protein
MIENVQEQTLAFIQAPTVFQNPNPSVPLAAVVQFAANKSVQTTVELSDGDRTWAIKFDQNPAAGLPIVGMRPNRRHELTISIQDAEGNIVPAPTTLSYTTPSLPIDDTQFPPLRVTVSQPARMEPGLTLTSIRRRRFGQLTDLTQEERNFLLSFGLLVALDAAGEVVWYHQMDICFSDFTQLRNGNILYLTLDHHIVEIDLLGNVVASWRSAGSPFPPRSDDVISIDTLSFHHFIDELPNGNIIAFSTVAQVIDNYWSSEEDPNAPRTKKKIMGDEIVEFQRDGTVVWRWKAFDWLDPYRMGYESFYIYWLMHGFPDYVDWTHGNGLWLDESDDSLIISLRHQDALFKIDRKSGEIKWILGEPTDWSESLQKKLFQPEAGMRWPYHTHAPSITPQGTILLFDNGNYRARPFAPPFPPGKSYSRAVEYAIDPDKMTVRQVWESDTAEGDAMVTYAMGDADWLPKTKHVLVTYGVCYPRNNITDEMGWMTMNDMVYQTRIREVAYTNPPEIVWEIRMDEEGKANPTHRWQAYGADRIPGLYKSANLDGK